MNRLWFVPGSLVLLFLAGCGGSFTAPRIGTPKTDFCPICEYHPTLFVSNGFNPTPDHPFVQPTGNGWPMNATVVVQVKYEPVGGPNGAYAGVTSGFRTVGTFSTDSFGGFGYVPDTTTPVASICGFPPQNATLLQFIAQDSRNHLMVALPVSNSF